MINGCLNWQHSTLDCVSRGCFPRSFDGCYRAAAPSTHRTNFLNFFRKMRPSRIVVNITTNNFSAPKINGIFLTLSETQYDWRKIEPVTMKANFIHFWCVESEFIVKNKFHNWTSELGCIWHIFGKLGYFWLFLENPDIQVTVNITVNKA